jgi:hypothetical protein
MKFQKAKCISWNWRRWVIDWYESCVFVEMEFGVMIDHCVFWGVFFDVKLEDIIDPSFFHLFCHVFIAVFIYHCMNCVSLHVIEDELVIKIVFVSD